MKNKARYFNYLTVLSVLFSLWITGLSIFALISTKDLIGLDVLHVKFDEITEWFKKVSKVLFAIEAIGLLYLLETFLIFLPADSYRITRKKGVRTPYIWAIIFYWIIFPIVLGVGLALVDTMPNFTSILVIVVCVLSIVVTWLLTLLHNRTRFVEAKDYRDDVKLLREMEDKEAKKQYFRKAPFETVREELQVTYKKYLADQEKIKAQEYKELHKVDKSLEHDGKSVFDGNMWQYIGWKILGKIITFLTLGICYPLAVCLVYKWEVKHTVINGRRLSFDGRGIQLFGKWILWYFLTIITLGIYGFFMSIKVKGWIVKHSHMYGGKEDVPSKFNGRALPFVGMKLLTLLIKLFTLGLLTPLADAKMLKWEAKRTSYNGYHTCFNGNGLQLFGKYVLWTFLGVITLGIFFLFRAIRYKKWVIKHTCLLALKEESEK